jgi:endonuclease YncB( thermonuclease family)
MARELPATRHRLLYALYRYHLGLVTLLIFSAGCFFLVGAVRFKIAIGASAPERFTTNDTVRIIDVIDGDELLIANSDGARTVLRLLGIRSFNPTVSDPTLSEYGRICFNYLKGLTLDQDARLEISEKRIDDEGRLLGTLYLEDGEGGDGKWTVDVAGDLIQKGYTLVYTKYDFERMDQYLSIQRAAKDQKAGLWSDPKIASRADSMVNMWTRERVDD